MKETRHAAGFTVLEMVCALAIIALLLATVLPAFPRGTSRPQLEAYALKTAALLKADRNAAILREAKIATELNTAARSVRSGASGEVLQLPRDVGFRAIIASQCGAQVLCM